MAKCTVYYKYIHIIHPSTSPNSVFVRYCLGKYSKNSFNPTTSNLGNPDNLALRRVVPRLDILLLPEKSLIIETGLFHGHVQTASKSVCTSTVVAFLDPFSPMLTTSAVNSPENRREP
jgi:hypothetical protein